MLLSSAACAALTVAARHPLGITAYTAASSQQQSTVASANACVGSRAEASCFGVQLRHRQNLSRYRLRDKDFETLPHAVDANPRPYSSLQYDLSPDFSPTHLFRRPDVVRAAIQRWGSVPAMWNQVRSLRP